MTIERIYDPAKCAVFRYNKDEYGMFSNMYKTPLKVNGITFLTSEALYQACRFPAFPKIQQQIIKEKSPMSAKGLARSNADKTREDWYSVNVPIMRWCILVKYLQHHENFGRLLDGTSGDIVESSARDNFWGAIPQKDGTLVGTNALGRLLMGIRDDNPREMKVSPLSIPNFTMLGFPIQEVE